MKTAKLILLCLSGMFAMQSATAQSRSEKKAQTERNVREAIRNDSVFSYLPYFGVAYNVPYGGGKGLIFNAPITGYRKESLKKGKTRIDFKTGNEEDKYEYSLTIYSDGSANIHIQPMNRQAISYSGELDIKE